MSRRVVGEFVQGSLRAKLIEQRETLGPPKYWLDMDLLGASNQWESFGKMESDELPRQLHMLRQNADYVAAPSRAR